MKWSQESLLEEGTVKLCFKGGLRVNQKKVGQAWAEEFGFRQVELLVSRVKKLKNTQTHRD